MATVGDKVRELRLRLEGWDIPPECRSFAGKPLHDFALDFFPASIGLAHPGRHSISTILLGTDWASEQTFVEWSQRKKPVAGNSLLTPRCRLYPLPVRRASALPPASFRLPVARDAVAFR